MSRGKYKCNICQQIFSKKETQLDHVVPVVNPETGWTTFDDFVERLFCYEAGYQVLCVQCHNNKTQLENVERREVKKNNS